MGADRPRKCPVCDYDLRGLPCPHRCPECGMPYDRTMRIWRPHGRRAAIPLVLAAIPVVGGAVRPLVTWNVGTMGATVEKCAWLFLVVALAGAVILVQRIQRRRAVIITPAGVCVRTGDAYSLVAWEELRDIVLREDAVIRRGDNVRVVLRRRNGTTEAIESFFNRDSAEEFQTSALAAQARYLQR